MNLNLNYMYTECFSNAFISLEELNSSLQNNQKYLYKHMSGNISFLKNLMK